MEEVGNVEEVIEVVNMADAGKSREGSGRCSRLLETGYG